MVDRALALWLQCTCFFCGSISTACSAQSIPIPPGTFLLFLFFYFDTTSVCQIHYSRYMVVCAVHFFLFVSLSWIFFFKAFGFKQKIKRQRKQSVALKKTVISLFYSLIFLLILFLFCFLPLLYLKQFPASCQAIK